jgi:hypothetical protein
LIEEYAQEPFANAPSKRMSTEQRLLNSNQGFSKT